MSASQFVGDEPTAARFAGSLLVAGTVVFWVGSFTPVPIDYTGPVAEQYVDVEKDPLMWVVSHALYLIGIGLTTAGLYTLATLFDAANGRRFAITGFGMHVIALGTFAVGTYYRVTLPGSGDTVPALFEAAMAGWLYASYLLLTLGAFALLGVALVIGSPWRRLGGYAVGLSLTMIALFGILGDLPPFVFYLITLPIGVLLVRRAARAMETA